MPTFQPQTAPVYRAQRIEGLLRPFWLFLLATLVLTSVSRVGLMLWQGDRFESLATVLRVLGYGVRIDLSTACYWLAPALLLRLALPAWRWVEGLVRLWLVAGLVAIAFMEAATPGFVQQYDLRPNRLFVEYLQYPQEVFAMLRGGFLPELLSATAVLLLAPVLSWRLFARHAPLQRAQLEGWGRLLGLGLLVLPLLLGARGTLQHRPMNPSYVAFSPDPLVNHLALNSFYALAFTLKAMHDEIDASALYPSLSRETVFEEVRRAMGEGTAFSDPAVPTLHRQRPAAPDMPRYRNLVIVLEESLGAQYVGALGGQGLTPQLDALAGQGWFFERLYATGTRSVRGIEAVVTGFVPTPARSVVKLPGAQQKFFTLASLLGKRGYDTSFIYGGEAHFDNMASFFLGNGFERVLDQRDYENPRFLGSWGVSDQDLFAKADAEFSRLHAAGQPFFSLVFSSSNHTPYDYPAGVIDPVGPPRSRDNAIRYADHALGEFLARARQSNYWDDTLFLVVADHDDRVYGRELVPIEHFRIPGLLLGEGLPPLRDARIVSQIDLATTALALLGVEAEHPMIGRDLTRQAPDYVGRAIMQYDRNQAYLRGNRVVVLRPGQSPAHFTLDPASHRLTPAPPDAALAREALAHALWGAIAYKEGLYPGAG